MDITVSLTPLFAHHVLLVHTVLIQVSSRSRVGLGIILSLEALSVLYVRLVTIVWMVFIHMSVAMVYILYLAR